MHNDILVTFGAALALGVFFVLVAHRIHVSAIVLLLLGGIAVGPIGLGLVHPEALGDGLKTIIALSVGLILFEGGLTLDWHGYRQASREIVGMLTRGVLITWGLSTLAIRLVFDQPWTICLLGASLIIVTGPTVIGPLLKRIRVKKRLHHILHWEGVLIDPIGVFIALLCFEWISHGHEEALSAFGGRVFIGIAIGLASGFILVFVITRKWIQADGLNIFALASAVAIFTVSDVAAHESGLLSVTIAGFVVGHFARAQMANVKRYKAELTELLIGLLFVLLAANLDVTEFARYGWGLLGVVLIVMLVVRPLNILVSTFRSDLSVREKLFLSWVAPRGIVAASMASLFAIRLAENPNYDASFLEVFTYSVIAGTVLFQGFTAKFVGRWLGVLEPKHTGWLIVGAHPLACRIASFIEANGMSAVLIDLNGRHLAQAKRQGLTTVCANVLTCRPSDHPDLYGIGNILAITTNKDLNTLACARWNEELVEPACYRWGAAAVGEDDGEPTVGEQIWPDLQLDRIVANALDNKDVDVFDLKSTASGVRHPDRVIMCAANGKVLPQMFDIGESDCHVLSHLPFDSRLDVELRSSWIVLSEAANLGGAVAELLERLKQDHPNVDTASITERLRQQSQEYTCFIGYGIGMPHAYTDALDESVVLLSKLREPITCELSGEKMEALFLVLSPEDQPKKHLNALSEISRFIMDDKNRSSLLDADCESELVDLLFPRSN
ncbi:MAG: NhaP-type Na+/H+ or K+/H+ antiporter/mannitol [Rhodothermales bacterium]|jgi:NhaP-type Na+/H+ or K+/H+ antiporter/mannitol/fructose-specific phosphotransferase system IIA component (Ntr-type)